MGFNVWIVKWVGEHHKKGFVLADY